MKKTFKILAVVLCAALLMGIGAMVTFALLQDSDESVNVMTLGNVHIEQIEQERDANGNLVDFTQAKPLYPAWYEGTSIPYADASDWPYGNEAWKVVEDNENVIDKFVTVKNTGKSDAYVRTIIAYEGDPISGPDIHVVHNDNNSANADVAAQFEAVEYFENVVINDVRYDVIVYTYANPLAAGETTIPSLKQVYLDVTTGNEVVESFGETYDILVLSQAVQTKGFTSASEALNAAFGDITTTNHPWTDGVKIPVVVSTADELKDAIAKGGNVMLTEDIELTSNLMPTKDVVIDLNGNTIKTTASSSLFQSQSNAAPSMIITSSKDGAVIDASNSNFNNGVVHSYGKTEIRNVTINAGSNKVVQVQGNGSVEIYDTVINADSGNTFNVAGDFTLGKGTVVNVTNLNSNLINNNGAHKIVIDGAKINIGTFKVNGSSVISLNNASTLEMKNTAMKIDNFVLSPFGGDSLVSKVDGVTIANCTFDVTDSNGASCTFEAKDGKYRLVQK